MRFKTKWCNYLTDLEEKLNAYKEKIGISKIDGSLHSFKGKFGIEEFPH